MQFVCKNRDEGTFPAGPGTMIKPLRGYGEAIVNASRYMSVNGELCRNLLRDCIRNSILKM